MGLTRLRIKSILANVFVVNTNTGGSFAFQGTWDGSTNALTNAMINATAGYLWKASAGTTTLVGPDGGLIYKGAGLLALINNPGSDPSDETKWMLIQSSTAP